MAMIFMQKSNGGIQSGVVRLCGVSVSPLRPSIRRKPGTYYRVKKKWDLKKNGHNYSEIRQKKKKLVCFGKFSLNAAGLASNLSILVEKWHRKMNMKLVTPL